MNRQDIIDMVAKVYGVVWTNEAQLKDLERFAALVASEAVRETSAEYRLGWNDGQIAEREACAKWCETLTFIDGTGTAEAFADEVRNRGQD